MAAPIVSGAVALFLSKNPKATPEKVITVLFETGTFINDDVGRLVQINDALGTLTN